ncbi:MAG: SDR family NAD(P)-dependent oxidoreductase [Verrucomicrobiota bacterium]
MHSDDVPADLLLGRPVVEVADSDTAGYLEGSSVVVTGAAGSIGSELSVRLARLGARELVLVDQAEAALVELARRLEQDHAFTAVPVLADVRSSVRVREIFQRHRPDVVFHAAAYKQVPLLERNPVEAVTANVFATRSVVDAAGSAGARRLILFSTDKAVRPTGVLGRTKALAEWVVAAAARGCPGRRYGAIRLGNVIDSAGTILPVFRRQIEAGRPVTVTHPGAARYLMTAGEAAGLALAAGGLADGHSIFWLDVRPAVRVVDLVLRLAEALGREVAIDLIGLRPGERLHEHFFWEPGDVEPTPCEMICRSALPEVDPGWLNERLAALAAQVDRASAAEVRATLDEMIAAARTREEALAG